MTTIVPLTSPMSADTAHYEPGAVLLVRRPLWTHYGIAYYGGQVIHNTKTGEKRVVRTSLQEFAHGGHVEICKHIVSRDKEATLRYAVAALEHPYDLLNSNCEHFVREACGERKQSTQVQEAVAVAAVALLIGVGIWLSGKNGGNSA